MNYLKNGNPIVLYRRFGKSYYGEPDHALVVLDYDQNGRFFIVNPYYISDGNKGQKAGGYFDLEQFTKLLENSPRVNTNSFGSTGVLLN